MPTVIVEFIYTKQLQVTQGVGVLFFGAEIGFQHSALSFRPIHLAPDGHGDIVMALCTEISRNRIVAKGCELNAEKPSRDPEESTGLPQLFHGVTPNLRRACPMECWVHCERVCVS